MPEDDINEQNETRTENRSHRENAGDLLLGLLKVLGIIVAVLVLMVVVGFGLLVGFCALSARH